ncbi:MAG: M20/M25/M40 family metallo-hydrolase [Spirochaetaceae bacterium]
MSKYVELGRRLWATPEGGFIEWKTQKLLVEGFTAQGFEVEPFGEIPGFLARWPGADRPKVALISDMDALPLGGGRYRHMCGHHQQLTALLGTASEMRSSAPDLLEVVSFIAFPGEEYVELERREEIRAAGTITYLSGKQEMLHRGLLDGYRAVIATHTAGLPAKPSINSVRRMNGFEELAFLFRGLSAHAGAAPHNGRNAQNAGSLFLQAAAFLRERFREEEHIRIHPVLRLPPEQPVSFIPDTVRVETYVRGATPEAVGRTTDELIQAAEGCATAIGVEVEVTRRPGYLPLKTNETLHRLVGETASELGIPFDDEAFGSASTDVGDISQRIPAVIVGLPGTNGALHRPDFQTVDEELAYEFPPRFLIPYLRNVIAHLEEL